jgi:TamB, inner membrane protein subunit of TAM complex/AsmA-like C-terminal region
MNETPPPAPPHGFDVHHLPPLRLFGIVLLFLVACAYAVWKSDRFQGLIHGVSQSRLAEALGRPVTFRTVEIRVFPPSVRLADVRIGNAPGLPGPLLTAEEVSIGGGVSVVGRELRLGKIRALRPHAHLSQLPDGTWNLPPGLSGPSRGGLKLHIGSVLVQEGVLEVQGRKIGIDGALEDFTAELVSVASDRYRGSLEARRATLKLPGAEPLVMALSTRFVLDAARGLTLEDASVSGAFGKLAVTGSLETAGRANAVFTASGDVSIDEIERVFHSGLNFSGGAHVQARIDVPPAGGFRIAAAVAAPRVRSNQFVFENLAATVAARPESLTARIDRADYAGGKASGVFRIFNLTGKPQPMTLAVEGSNISLERFFADISLKGTGLSGAAALSVAMRWGAAGISHADGGGMVSIAAGPAASMVAGRVGVPTSGGGALAIVNGRIGLEAVTLKFPQSTLELTGGLKIGVWQPDFDFQLQSKDLAEVDRLYQNFLAAAGEKPERLGLGGSGELQGHLAGTWTNPDATVQITAEAARYSGVPFGSVHGVVDMRDGAFLFHPLRVYDGDASLSLEGTARYRPAPGRPRFDLAVSARAYPLPRLLQYLDLDFPVEGKVTGDLRVAGTPPEAVTGGGPIELADAVVWGQKLARVTGRVRIEPGRFAIDDMRAALGGGTIGGSGALAIKQRTFEARLAGDAVPLEAVDLFRPLSPDVTGKLSFQLSGGGSLDRPDLKVTASISQATFYGHPVPENHEPRVEATVTRGVLDASAGVPERWSLKASGDLFGDPPRMDLSLDATDLGAFLLLTPLALPAGGGGSLAVAGNLTLPRKAGEFSSGTLTVTRAQLDFPGRPGVIATKGNVRVALGQGKLTFQEFEASGEGTLLKINGSIGFGQKPVSLALAVSGNVDASLLSIASPDLAMTGRLVADLRASGSLDAPVLSGSVRVENGKYRMTGLAQVVDNIDGGITFRGARGDVEARARTGGGDVYAAGNFGLKGLALGDFRFSIQARHVAVRYPQDLRLVVDADLVATSLTGSNVVRGEVVLQRGTYSKDIELTISDLLSRGRPAGAVAREPWKEATALEVRIVSAAALEVRNNLARLTATVDLLVRGSLASPTLVGQIFLDEGGRITFRDVRYEIEQGTIAFANTEGFEPIIDIRVRAEVKGYDVGVSLVGTWPRIQTSLSSDPPLPDEMIVGLLLTGAAPSARATTDTTGQIVSAAGGIVGGAATGVLTRPTQRLFKLDRFEIDPIFTGSGPVDVRSTVGKQITPNLLVTYSQSIDSSKEPIFQFEWWISDTMILQGRRDENGIYSIDVRRRQRF